LEELSKRVAKSAGGQLVLEPQPAGKLFPVTKEFDAVKAGIVEGSVSPAYYWKDKFPAATLFTYQVGGMTPFESIIWWERGGGKALAQRMVNGHEVMVFQGMLTPPAVFFQAVKPIEIITDYKGLKIAVGGDSADVLALLAASPVSLPIGEVRGAIERKEIEACAIGSLASHLAGGIHEVTKYLYLSAVRQPVDWSVITISKPAFEALPDALKRVVEAEMSALTPWFYAWTWQQDVEALAKIKSYNLYVRNAPQDIEMALMKQAEVFYKEKTGKEPFSAEVYQSITTFMNTYRKTWPAISLP